MNSTGIHRSKSEIQSQSSKYKQCSVTNHSDLTSEIASSNQKARFEIRNHGLKSEITV